MLLSSSDPSIVDSTVDNSISVNTAEDRRGTEGRSHGHLTAVSGTAHGEPCCSKSVEPSSSTHRHSETLLTDSEHEVSTSVTDERVRPNQTTNKAIDHRLLSSSSSDHQVTCSLGADEEEALEKEEGEITDDEMDDGGEKQCEVKGSRTSTEDQCSGAFQWDRRGSGQLRQPGGSDGSVGGHWKRCLPPPVTPVSSDRAERNVTSEDPECQDPKHGTDNHLIGSPITSDEEDAVVDTQLLYFKEPKSAAEFSDSELSGGERVRQNSTREQLSGPKGRGVRTGSPMSSSDSEENQINKSNEVGTKRKACDLLLLFLV